MSKYIKIIPLARIARVALVPGNGQSLSRVKGDADYCVNCWFYDRDDGKATGHLKIDGQTIHSEPWSCWGYGWERGEDTHMLALPASTRNYLSGVELLTRDLGRDSKLSYRAEVGGKRGRAAIALTGDKLVLYCSGDGTSDASTPEELRDELYRLGCESALMLDGGGSAQCDFGGGQVIRSGRRVAGYLCCWLKKEEEKPLKKICCLDPGHGPGCVNGSPDGAYKEHEFAYALSMLIQSHLERCGISVVLTRDKDGFPSLTERAGVSNKARADLMVSIHSNACAGTGWHDARGLLIYTSAAGANAGRNIAANAILEQMKSVGVMLKGGGLLHNPYTVLTKTVAPAVLIEYGFHDNREDTALLLDAGHRAELAEATAKGICQALGEDWVPGDEPWYRAAQDFVIKHGISDGTRPGDPAMRAEIWEMLRKIEAREAKGRKN